MLSSIIALRERDVSDPRFVAHALASLDRPTINRDVMIPGIGKVRRLLRPQFSLRVLLIAWVMLCVSLAVLWWWPRSAGLSCNPKWFTGYYRGLGLTDGPGLLGRSWYRVEFAVTEPEHGKCIVFFDEPGFNRFEARYPDGSLRAEGECYVTLNGGSLDPVPEINNVKSGRYYKPNGELGSEVVNGTGTETYWAPNGTKLWELELKNYQRQQLSWWYPNGAKKVVGTYDGGKRVGPWSYYTENGELEKTVDYSESHD